MGIQAWDKLTAKQVAKILELAGQARITELQIEKIIELSKYFAPLSASVFQVVEKAAAKSSENQLLLSNDHSDTFSSALNALRAILAEMKDEENKVKLAQMIADLAKARLEGIEAINRRNNSFWEFFSVVAASLMAAGALALSVAK